MRAAETTLAKVCESVRYGYTASASNEEVGPRFLRITDIVPESINWDSVPFCPIEDGDRERFALQPGDIVVARTGATVGYAKLIREEVDAVFASYLVRFRVDEEKAYPRYVGHLVESSTYKSFVQSQVGGAAQPNANAQVLGTFKFSLPSRREQEKIASVLSAYDELMENNRRRMGLLEEAARLLYRDWFVRLHFPGHEHARLTKGVPEGWERVPTPEAVEINPTTKLSDEEEHWYVEMADLPTDSMVIQNAIKRDGRGGSKFRNGDTLLARITPCLENGKTGFVNFMADGEAGRGSTEFIVLRSKRVTPEFVYCLARTYHFRENAVKSMIGSSGRQRVQESCFEKFMVWIPQRSILDLFSEFAEPVFHQIKTLHLQNQKLRAARDLLLPRLMSGEIAI
jgi:type I restriction enzyme S subunit